MDGSRAHELISGLIGRWEGTGLLEYPTIDTAQYREILDVAAHAGDWPLHYLQRTWKQTDEGEKPSHVETGFISVEDSGLVTVLNAQGPDRIESLKGRIVEQGDSWRLRLDALVHAHDPRMRAATRTLIVKADRIEYTMGMVTDRVEPMTRHLAATLTRTGP